jgi:hypothetical protein
MTITVVQKSTQGNATATPGTTTFPSLPTAGNTIIVTLALFSATAVTVTDNQTGNTYTLVPSTSSFTASACGVAMYICSNVKVTTGTFTVSAAITGASIVCISEAIEVSGLASSPNDQATASKLASASTTRTVTAPGANAQANELVVAVLSADTGSASSAITDPPTTGYTSMMVQQNGSTFVGAEAAYKVVTAVETSSAVWTSFASASTSAWAIATFKAAPSGGLKQARWIPGRKWGQPGSVFPTAKLDTTYVPASNTVAGAAIGFSSTVGVAGVAASLAASGLSGSAGISQPSGGLQASGLSSTTGIAQEGGGENADGISVSIGAAQPSASVQAVGVSASAGSSQAAALLGASGLSSSIGIADSSGPAPTQSAAGVSISLGAAQPAAFLGATGLSITLGTAQSLAGIAAAGLSSTVGIADTSGPSGASSAIGLSVTVGISQPGAYLQAIGFSSTAGRADTSPPSPGGTALHQINIGVSFGLGLSRMGGR